jgi:mitochondrial fission protein ELM1
MALLLKTETPVTCWVVTDGKAGMESQCLGLAEALGVTPIVKRVVLRTPWRQFTPYVRYGLDKAFARKGDPIAPPWPDLLIATGRQSIPASLLARAQSGKNNTRPTTVTVQIQDPALDPSYFDLVIAPAHDKLKGANVVNTHGALHRMTPSVLAEGARKLAPQLASLPRPLIGVLIGGTNNAYELGAEEMKRLAADLIEAAENLGGSLVITPSRRTSAEALAVLRAALHDTPHYLWDGQGDNPYFGILGIADYLVATPDSVNMVSEAVSTGKPVFIAPLPGGSQKFARFHRLMRDEGLTRALSPRLTPYAYTPPDDMAVAAARVRALLAARGVALTGNG